MKLNHVNIEGKETLHEHFSFKAVWQIIETCPDAYLDTLEKMADKGSMELPGYTHSAPVDLRIRTMLEYLEGKSRGCPVIISQWLKTGDEAARRVDEAALKKQLDGMDEGFWAKNEAAVEALLMKEENYHFSLRAAALFYLFLLLHIQAKRNIGEVPADRKSGETRWALPGLNKWDALEFMKQSLRKEGSYDYLKTKSRRIYLPEGTDDFALPLRTGTKEADAPLEIVKIVNNSTNPSTVTLKGSSIKRQLFPDEWIYALRKGGEYVSFLPRFAVTERQLLTWDKGEFLLSEQEKRRKLSGLAIPEPAIWSYDEDEGEGAGFFAVDWEGNLYTRSRENVPAEQKAVWVSVYYDTYGVLWEDGTLGTSPWGIPKEERKELMGISIGLNNSVGIRNDRSLVLAEYPEGFPGGRNIQAVEAGVHETHLIWLDPEGKVHTEQEREDGWEKKLKDVAAVDISEKGYFAARDREIYRIPFDQADGALKPLKITKSPVTELKATDDLIVYRMMDDRNYHREEL